MLFEQFGRFAESLGQCLAEHRQTLTAKSRCSGFVLGSDSNRGTFGFGGLGAGNQQCLTLGFGGDLLVGRGNDSGHRVGNFFVEREFGDLQVDHGVSPARELLIQSRLGVVDDLAAKAEHL